MCVTYFCYKHFDWLFRNFRSITALKINLIYGKIVIKNGWDPEPILE